MEGAQCVAPVPQIAKLSKKSQNNGFEICELVRVTISIFFFF